MSTYYEMFLAAKELHRRRELRGLKLADELEVLRLTDVELKAILSEPLESE